MAFTRFHDDPARIKKQLEIASYANRYYLDKPGQGTDLPFSEDPQCRLQGWGANLQTNTVGLEGDLFGMTRPLCRDNIDMNQYKDKAAATSTVSYRSVNPYTDESRATHPAWTYRDSNYARWEEPWINPQANFEVKFPTMIQTRILEKDNFEYSRGTYG